MTAAIKIDFVSDVSCPWCVIGLLGLEQALDRVGALVEADIRFQPFELNPDMPFEGQRLVDYAAQKYGSNPDQLSERRAMIRARAAELGFTIALPAEEGRVYNALQGLSPQQAALVKRMYRKVHGEDLAERIDSEFSGDEYKRAMALLDSKPLEAAGKLFTNRRLNTR